jgi:chorismate-pyruvate lyase
MFEGSNVAIPSIERQLEEKFDPLADLFIAQKSKPAHLREINLRAIEPFQRAILTIDGTVTKFIEAYMMEPVVIVRLAQETRQLPSYHPWLEAAQGTDVIAREVLLQGEYSRRIYAYAVSLLAADQLPPDIKQQLKPGGEGIGRIIINNRMESFRDILWYGKEHVPQLPDAIKHLEGVDFISRTYRIIVNKKPVMLINEKFPTFQDWLPSHH